MSQTITCASTRRCTLTDGQTVWLRQVRREDATELVALFGRLSAETRWLRLFSSRRVELAEAEIMAAVNHHQCEAVVACLDPGRCGPIVALASYEQICPGVAEIAFVVDDTYQGRGLGRDLLVWLIAAAQADGVHRFQGEALATNGRMLRLVCQRAAIPGGCARRTRAAMSSAWPSARRPCA